jgi:DNA-binding transcriptional ArsR family regulator
MNPISAVSVVTSARRTADAPSDELALLQAKAAEAARLMRLLANENRLLLLCHLAAVEEMGAGALAEALGLSPSAASQHLALLREDGLVATRREAQAIFYRIADPKVARLLGVLRELYCPPAP